MDEVIATARTACDMLDDYPEIFITRGEAWFYEILAACAPDTYVRVKRHIAAGRWQVVGGWYVQPDCNQPSPESFRRQYELSVPVWHDLGVRPTVGYNVDSFGHAATLPDFYRECGVDSYVITRPGNHEFPLPDLFQWESPRGNRITVVHPARYFTKGKLQQVDKNIQDAAASVDPAVGHAFCMIGVGDHGGGPTRREVEYLLAHRHYAPGVELVFSHPRAFFDAVAPHIDRLPVIRGELQHHAVGCYSVMRRIKSSHRRCEELMLQFETVAAALPNELREKIRQTICECGKSIAFNEFHDIMGGCAIKEALDQAQAELDGAAAELRNQTSIMLRRKVTYELPPDAMQRAVFCNTSPLPYRGVVEFEPWLSNIRLVQNEIDILDEAGEELEYQKIPPGTPDTRINRYLLPLEIPAGGMRVLKLRHHPVDISQQLASPPATENTPEAEEKRREFTEKYPQQFFLDPDAGSDVAAEISRELTPLQLTWEIIRDDSDTWSHYVTGYPSDAAEYRYRIERGGFRRIAAGKLCTLARQDWSCPVADVETEVGIYRPEPIVRLRIRVNWRGTQQVMKLRIAPGITPDTAWCGCPGDRIKREFNGQEKPFYNFVLLSETGSGKTLAVVSRDVYGGDLQPDGSLRLTILRSPYYVHHHPFMLPESSMHPVCDRGEHDILISLISTDAAVADKRIAAEIQYQSRPVYFLESTFGCERAYLDL